MTASKIILLFLAVLLVALPLCHGQSPDTVFRGTVNKIAHPDPTGTHVWLQTNNGSQEVCLGDTRFLADNSFTPKVGDSIAVTGYRDGSVLVADSIERDDQRLSLTPSGGGRYRGHHCGDHHDYHGGYGCSHSGHHCGHE